MTITRYTGSEIFSFDVLGLGVFSNTIYTVPVGKVAKVKYSALSQTPSYVKAVGVGTYVVPTSSNAGAGADFALLNHGGLKTAAIDGADTAAGFIGQGGAAGSENCHLLSSENTNLGVDNPTNGTEIPILVAGQTIGFSGEFASGIEGMELETHWDFIVIEEDV